MCKECGCGLAESTTHLQFFVKGYTTDGLHPDLTGKKYIGQTVDSYLRTHFAYASAEAERRVRMLKNMEKTS